MASRVSQHAANDYFIRKASLDDIEFLNGLISSQAQSELNLLFDHPNLLTLFERYKHFYQDPS